MRRHALRKRRRLIDRPWIGHELGSSVLLIERSRLRFFATAVCETDPVYTDEAAARGASRADLPAPPTFLFATERDSGATDRLLANLGVPIATILHGRHGFRHHGTACAGDVVTVDSRIADRDDRENGALEFTVEESRAVNQRASRIPSADRRGCAAADGPADEPDAPRDAWNADEIAMLRDPSRRFVEERLMPRLPA